MGKRHQVRRRHSYGRRLHEVHERTDAPSSSPAHRLDLLDLIEASLDVGVVQLRPVPALLSSRPANIWAARRGLD